jgi:S1-C subfamily serine protease
MTFSTKLFLVCAPLTILAGAQLPATAAPKTTYWDHNGSIVYLIADGVSRQFYYHEPRPGMLQEGARPGTLLFRGRSIQGGYVGTAYLFDRTCGPTPYQVSGPILDDYHTVVLRGQAPRIDADCRVQGYFTDTLKFTLLGSSPPEDVVASPKPPQPPGGPPEVITPRTVPSTVPPAEPSVSSGTSFSVSKDGSILTNYHVVDHCKQILVRDWGSASIKAYDDTNDLALLRVEKAIASVTFRTTPVGLGETVFALGFPYPGILGQGLNVTDGLVSALSGIQNDTRYLQVTAPVQPGNSGGPLVDTNGLVVGIVSMRMNEIEVLKRSGTLPQNVNFAIRADLAKSFLRANAVDPAIEEPMHSLSASEIAKRAQAYTVQVVCLGASAPKMGVRGPGALPANSR